MKNSALVLFLDRVPLMSVPCEEQGAKRPVFWCVLSLVLFAGILLCAVKTYDSLIESFGIQSSMMLFVWMGVLLVLLSAFCSQSCFSLLSERTTCRSGMVFADRPFLPVGSFTMCRCLSWHREISGTASPSIIHRLKQPSGSCVCSASDFWRK